MVKILHGADFHLGLTRFSGRYDASEDAAQTLRTFTDTALEERVDLAIIAGDLFHTRRPGPGDLYEAVRAIEEITSSGVTLIITPGNHDGPSVIEDPRSHTLAWLNALNFAGLHVVLEENAFATNGVRVVSVPYPHKRAYDDELSDEPLEERVKEASRRLEIRIKALIRDAKRMDTSYPLVFIGHLTVEGAMLGTEREMHVGWDVTLPQRVLRPFHYSALGHIHRQQAIGPAWYAGSPSYVSFSEEGDPKGFLLAEIEGNACHVDRVDSNARPVKTFDLYGTVLSDDEDQARDAIVKVRIHGDVDPADLNRIIVRLRNNGAAYIGLEHIRDDETPSLGADYIDAEFGTIGMLAEYLDLRSIPHEPAMSRARELISDEV